MGRVNRTDAARFFGTTLRDVPMWEVDDPFSVIFVVPRFLRARECWSTGSPCASKEEPMIRKLSALVLGLVFVVGAGTTFGAINSTPDENRHPALASTCIKTLPTDPWTCVAGSGILVAPDIVLGVAHAGPWLDQVRPAKIGFTFDEKITSNPVVYEVAQFIPDPLFAWDQQDPHDLAIFIMKDTVTGIRPVSLPPVLYMLDKGNKVSHVYFTLVDRGLTTVDGWPDYPVWTARVVGESIATELRPGALMLGANEKHPTQACFGASGSMALFTNTNIVVAVGSWFADWPSQICNGQFGFTRLDTQQARDFLQNYLPESLLPK